MSETTNYGNGTTTVKGLYYEIWKIVEKRLNFTTKVDIIQQDLPDKWNKMIGNVSARNYDLLLSGNSLTETRSKLVDFSFPLILTTVRLFYIKESHGTDWLVYLKSFLKDSWIGILITTLCTVLACAILNSLITKVFTVIHSNWSII